MRSHLVRQQRFNAGWRQTQIRVDQQLATRYDQAADIIGNPSTRLELGIVLPVERKLLFDPLGKSGGIQVLPMLSTLFVGSFSNKSFAN